MKKSILMLLTLTMVIVLFSCGDDKKNPTEPNKKIEIITTVPKAAFIGDTITVVGKNFGDSQGTGFIFFAGTQAKDYITWSDNEIVVQVPTGAESGKLWIDVNGEKSNMVLISIKPKITSIAPQSAFLGDTIIITGSNFGTSLINSDIYFAGMQVTNYITWWSDNERVVKVPEGAESGKLWLIVKGVKSNEVDFTIKDYIFENASVTDIDGKVYTSVKIGEQWWMSENLNVSRYRNGDPIRHAESDEDWFEAFSKNEGAWCYFKNDPANGEIYGKLYNWYAVNDSRGLAPIGYHVPSDAEWTILENYLGGKAIAGGKLKEAKTKHWEYPNRYAINSSGFTARPGGYRRNDTYFDGLRVCGNWWSASEFNDANGSYARERILYYNYDHIYGNYSQKGYGFSVRCIKD